MYGCGFQCAVQCTDGNGTPIGFRAAVINSPQTVAVVKCPVCNLFDTCGDRNGFQSLAVIEHIGIDLRHEAGKCDFLECIAERKQAVSDTCNGIRKVNACHCHTFVESFLSQCTDALGKCEALERFTAIKSTLANGGYGRRERQGCDLITIHERLVCDGCDGNTVDIGRNLDAFRIDVTVSNGNIASVAFKGQIAVASLCKLHIFCDRFNMYCRGAHCTVYAC